MKKIGVFLLVLLFSINATAQTPQDIVDKCVSALGGEEAVKKYLNYRAEGQLKVLQMGMELTGELEVVSLGARKWFRAEITVGNEVFAMTQAYDGTVAWMDRMGTIVDQPALNYESDQVHNITLLVEKEAVFSAGKEKEIGGRKAIGIDVEFKDKKTTFFIDLETYTILEMVFEDLYFGENMVKEMLEMKVVYGNYQKFDNVLFPADAVYYQKGKKQMELHFTDVSFSPQVADAVFERPDQALDLRYFEEIIH
ncbi:hypothetical protein ACFLRM_06435 [Acidobacteriota bacterium]